MAKENGVRLNNIFPKESHKQEKLDSSVFFREYAEHGILKKAILAAGGSESMALRGRAALSKRVQFIADGIDGKIQNGQDMNLTLAELRKWGDVIHTQDEWHSLIRGISAKAAVTGNVQALKILAELRGIAAFDDGSSGEPISETTGRRLAEVGEKIMAFPKKCPQCARDLTKQFGLPE
jgi:hypothetical protein